MTADVFAANAYDYVRNNIATEYRFGLGKGGVGALVDQSGAPFDQAELLVLLLREGGLTPSYKVGLIELTAEEFGRWTGLAKSVNEANQTFSVDAAAACKLLADGGIPATVGGASTCVGLSGNLATSGRPIVMGHVWVVAGGKVYDPAFTQHRLLQGVDLASVMQCGSNCASGARTAAIGPATTGTLGGAPFVQNLSETGLATQLNGYAVALESYIRDNKPDATVAEIVGGLDRHNQLTAPAATAFAYPATAVQSWTDVPDAYRSQLRVQFNGLDQTFFADEVAGKRIRMMQPPKIYPTPGFDRRMYVENILVQTTACAGCEFPDLEAIPGTVTLSAFHPYVADGGNYADETVVLHVGDVRPVITIMQAWGQSGRSTTKHFADLDQASPSPFAGWTTASSECETSVSWEWQPQVCRSDGQPTVVANYLAQTSAARNLIADVTRTAITPHHVLGLIAPMFGETHINLVEAYSIVSRENDIAARAGAFSTTTAVTSMLEGSIVQQSTDQWTLSSAIGYLRLANQKSIRLMGVPSGGVSAALSSLSGYSAARQTRLVALGAAGYDLILPQSATMSCFSMFNGSLCPHVDGTVAAKSDAAAYLIAGLYKGGGGGGAGSPDRDVIDSVKPKDYAGYLNTMLSVDLGAGGALIAGPPDIISGAGAFPLSLPFQRTYSSLEGVSESLHFYPTAYSFAYGYQGPGAEMQGSHLGGGWVHNYQVNAMLVSDGNRAFDGDSAVVASAAIVGVYTHFKLNAAGTFQDRLTAVFSAYWLSQTIVNNGVITKIGPKAEIFTRLPSGVFLAPDGSQSRLAQTGVRSAPGAMSSTAIFSYWNVNFTLTHGDGSTLTFTSPRSVESYGTRTFKGDTWTFPSGVVVKFHYAASGMDARTYILTKVSNNLGRYLDFYSEPNVASRYRISSVADETGRSVTYSRICPNPTTRYGGGQSDLYPLFLACDTFTATLPDGAVVTYDYRPDTASPDPAVKTRAPYRIRRWYAPSDATTPYQVIAYDDAFRVKTVTNREGEVMRYAPGAIAGTEQWKLGKAINPLGDTSTQIIDEGNRPLKAIDGLGRTTTFAYDGAGRLILKTQPEGNAEAYTYDVRSNLLTRTLKPKPGSGEIDLVTSTTYGEGPSVWACVSAKTCNRPFSEDGPRTDVSDVTNYNWSTLTGSPLQELAPADATGLRPQTDYSYTSYLIGGSYVSLITGKTEKINAADSVVTTFEYDAANRYVLKSMTVDSGGLSLRTCYLFDTAGNVLGVTDPRAATCPTAVQ